MRLQPLAMLGHVGLMTYGDIDQSTWLPELVEDFNRRYRVALAEMFNDLPDTDPIEVSPGAGVMAKEVEAFNDRYRAALDFSSLYVEPPEKPATFGFQMLADAFETNNRRYLEALATLATQE